MNKTLEFNIEIDEKSNAVIIHSHEHESGEDCYIAGYKYPFSIEQTTELKERVGKEVKSWIDLWMDELDSTRSEKEMEKKKTQIEYGIMQIKGILQMLRPEKVWKITYAKMNGDNIEEFSEWHRQYHGIRAGDEYFFIWEGDSLLYAGNVSAESALYSLSNLMKLLADKF